MVDLNGYFYFIINNDDVSQIMAYNRFRYSLDLIAIASNKIAGKKTCEVVLKLTEDFSRLLD